MSDQITQAHMDAVASNQLVSKYLQKHGFSVREFKLDKTYLEFTAPNNWLWVTPKFFLSYPFVSATADRIAQNKRLSYEFAATMGVATPRTLVMPEAASGLQKFLSTYAPVVVKPLSSFGSHGLGLDISSYDEARQAIKAAQKYSSDVLVQQQFTGEEVRFTVIRGRVASCLMRENPQVIGDGESTVAELIQHENLDRAMLKNNKLVPYPLLDDSLLPKELLTNRSVPKQGEVVKLGKTTLPNGGASIRGVTDSIHASYKDIAARLGRSLNAEFAVVDMMIADYTMPATDTNYIFLEFSLSPSLRLYYDVRGGQDYDILGVLAGMIKEMSERK